MTILVCMCERIKSGAGMMANDELEEPQVVLWDIQGVLTFLRASCTVLTWRHKLPIFFVKPPKLVT